MAGGSVAVSAAVSLAVLFLLYGRFARSNRDRERRSTDKATRVGSYALCLQKVGKFYIDGSALEPMTFAEATQKCAVQNRGRKKGNRLCVVPVHLAEQGSATVVAADVEKMAKKSEGNYLNMRRRGICDRDIAGVVEYFTLDRDRRKRFTHFGLTDNEVGDHGAKALMQADMEGTIELSGLFLSTNKVGRPGVCSLAQRMSNRNCRIVKLGLNFNGRIGDSGAEILARCIPDSSLEVLGLAHCNIGDQGCEALARALCQPSCSISRLFLNGNKVEDDGALAMASMLVKRGSTSNICTLLRLGMAYCKYSDKGAQALRASLEVNTSLERLCMFGNAAVSAEENNKLCRTERINMEPLHAGNNVAKWQ